jgi:hypothetical protein
MKYHEAINGPDGKLWKTEVAKEHQRMIDSGVFEPVKLSKVPIGVKLIDTTWAMKKKCSETIWGRVNVRGSSKSMDSTMMGHSLVHRLQMP